MTGSERWTVLRRLLAPWTTRGTPPTVPMDGSVPFHCPDCRTPVGSRATQCPSCGAELLGEHR